MRISRITVWQLDLPLTKPYWLSGGRLRFDKLDSTFVRIDTDEGVSGWGEGCPWGHTYLPAHGPGIRAGIETLAPHLIGADALALDALNRLMDVQLPGHLYVKSPIDMACWDILGKVSGLPLWRLFGGAAPEPVLVNSSISTGTPEQMIALIDEARTKGYRVHSAKVGGTDPHADIGRIEAISAAIRPGEDVTFDVNRAWTPSSAIRVLNSVAARNWIEQPCETLEECAHVARRVPQPIMLDECLHSFVDHLRAWILDGSPGSDEAQCDAVLIGPGVEHAASKLRSVVHDDARGQADRGGQAVQDARHAQPRQRPIDFDRDAFTGVVVDEVQRREAATVGECVDRKVHGPAHQPSCRRRQRHALADRQALATSPSHLQASRAIQAMHALVVHEQAVTFEAARAAVDSRSERGPRPAPAVALAPWRSAAVDTASWRC